MTSFAFRVTHRDGGARRGVMTTAHGEVETPAFMPVGTQGAVKAVTHRDLEALGAQVSGSLRFGTPAQQTSSSPIPIRLSLELFREAFIPSSGRKAPAPPWASGSRRTR